MKLVHAWNADYRKKGEKQDKKNSYLLPNSPIIRKRSLKKNANIGTVYLFAIHVTQSVTEQVSQIRSIQLEKKMLFLN